MSMKKTLGLDMKIVEGGAWIETTVSFTRIPAVGVAPRAGAWIETYAWDPKAAEHGVAPSAGAWIETLTFYQIMVTTHVTEQQFAIFCFSCSHLHGGRRFATVCNSIL